jgi:hypothetical protein
VVLLQPVVQVGTGPVPDILAQRGADRPGVAVVAVRGLSQSLRMAVELTG